MTLGTGSPGATVDFTGDFTITSGVGERIYLGTNAADFSQDSFEFEVEVTVPNTTNAWSIAFMGMGSTDASAPNFFEPLSVPNAMSVLLPNGFLGSRDNADSFPHPGADNFTVPLPPSSVQNGTHLLRMTWDHLTELAVFAIDLDNDGSVDGQFALNGADNGFDATNSRLFLGGGNGLSFDNVSVSITSVPEMTSSTLFGISAMLMGTLWRRRDRRCREACGRH